MTQQEIESFQALRGIHPCDIELTRKLDIGGVSDIWIARHPIAPFEFIVKYSKNSVENNQYLLGQFEREYEASQFLYERHVLDCSTYIANFDIDELHHPYLFVEYFPARPLDVLMPQIHEWEDIREILRKVARILSKIHAHGIVHRDIKPGNIIMNSQGDIRVIDFALSTLDGHWHPFHHEGIAIGTPLYMSPEQAYGKKIMLTSACDWYSLGIMMYEWMTGKVPFHGKTASDTIHMHCFDEPATPKNNRIHHAPGNLADIILDLLCKEPNARLSAVRRLKAMLEMDVNVSNKD